MPVIERTTQINASIERVFAFVTDIRNHPRVSPPETCEQVRGPFALWKHEHWFESDITSLKDRFTFSAPLGPLGRLAEKVWLTRRMLQLMEHLQAHEKVLIESEGE